ncbi:oxidative stress survival, Svf1-like protein [Lipomyces doorenjongii]|uniref:oxidative stress survival, Svf1-like protein n=1 Tax=Lipomyces doorenjongii TaxID=383834 RepID=UPI0034CF5646
MLKWMQSGLSAVAGTAEPIYGPEAIHSVVDGLNGANPFSEVKKEDLEWRNLPFTNVETQTFYLTTTSGHICFVQVILSNVAGLHTTSQFTCRIYHPDKPEESVWTSTHLNDFAVGADKTNFKADKLSIVLSEDLNTYTIKSSVNDKSIVDIAIVREAPGFKVGKDGMTRYGTDYEKPWGSMRHIFWPRATVKGNITVNGHLLEVSGRAMYVMALQGMKPHHAAARWNFVNFQGPTLSGVMMEFTTPPSYGSKIINVGAIARNNELFAATVENVAEHTKTKSDEANGWPEPLEVKFEWKGTSPDEAATPVDALLEAPIPNLVERVDVMSEIPAFVKKVVAGVAGTKPYIYQYSNPASIKVKFGDKEYAESGHLYSEATFIS